LQLDYGPDSKASNNHNGWTHQQLRQIYIPMGIGVIGGSL